MFALSLVLLALFLPNTKYSSKYKLDRLGGTFIKKITSDGWCLYVHNEIQLSHGDKYSWHLPHLTWYICPDLGNDLDTSWESGNLGQLDAVGRLR